MLMTQISAPLSISSIVKTKMLILVLKFTYGTASNKNWIQSHMFLQILNVRHSQEFSCYNSTIYMPIKRLDTFSSSSKDYECRKRIACLKGRISSLSYKMHHHHSSADPSLELRPKVESHDQNSKNDKEFNRRKQHCRDNQTRHN